MPANWYEIWLSLKTFYWVSGCGSLNLLQRLSYSTHLLFWGVYHYAIPLYTSLVNTWLSLAGSRHICTVPLDLITMTKLFYHSVNSFTHSGASILCCCSLSSSFIHSSYSAHVICLNGGWYSFASSMTSMEKVPLKHRIPVNTYIFIVISVVIILLASMCGPAIKQSISCLVFLLASGLLLH